MAVTTTMKWSKISLNNVMWIHNNKSLLTRDSMPNFVELMGRDFSYFNYPENNVEKDRYTEFFEFIDIVHGIFIKSNYRIKDKDFVYFNCSYANQREMDILFLLSETNGRTLLVNVESKTTTKNNNSLMIRELKRQIKEVRPKDILKMLAGTKINFCTLGYLDNNFVTGYFFGTKNISNPGEIDEKFILNQITQTSSLSGVDLIENYSQRLFDTDTLISDVSNKDYSRFTSQQDEFIDEKFSNFIDDDNKRIYFVKGSAGTGKTSIAIRILFEYWERLHPAFIIMNHNYWQFLISTIKKYDTTKVGEIYQSVKQFDYYSSINGKENDLIIIDEGQRVKLEELVALSKNHKKTLVFYDEDQVFYLRDPDFSKTLKTFKKENPGVYDDWTLKQNIRFLSSDTIPFFKYLSDLDGMPKRKFKLYGYDISITNDPESFLNEFSWDKLFDGEKTKMARFYDPRKSKSNSIKIGDKTFETVDISEEDFIHKNEEKALIADPTHLISFDCDNIYIDIQNSRFMDYKDKKGKQKNVVIYGHDDYTLGNNTFQYVFKEKEGKNPSSEFDIKKVQKDFRDELFILMSRATKKVRILVHDQKTFDYYNKKMDMVD